MPDTEKMFSFPLDLTDNMVPTHFFRSIAVSDRINPYSSLRLMRSWHLQARMFAPFGIRALRCAPSLRSFSTTSSFLPMSHRPSSCPYRLASGLMPRKPLRIPGMHPSWLRFVAIGELSRCLSRPYGPLWILGIRHEHRMPI